MLTWQDIEAARKRLAGIAHRTPVLTSRQFDEAAGARVFFKAENLQRGGAFKFRGAYNKIKAETERGKVDAVVAFSSGNHAQAVALVCRLLGIRATVVMPDDAPQAKIDGTRGYGAEVVLYDRASQSRDDLAEQICRERGAVLVPPFDDELVMAGQATGAVELLEDVGDLDAIVVPVSGGGLLGGWATVARNMRPGIAIYGAEPENADDTKRSLAAGHRVEVAENPTIADGLRVSSPGKLTFPIVQETVKDILLVSDDEMIETLTWMLERM
jgi:threonine dehydratase